MATGAADGPTGSARETVTAEPEDGREHPLPQLTALVELSVRLLASLSLPLWNQQVVPPSFLLAGLIWPLTRPWGPPLLRWTQAVCLIPGRPLRPQLVLPIRLLVSHVNRRGAVRATTWPRMSASADVGRRAALLFATQGGTEADM